MAAEILLTIGVDWKKVEAVSLNDEISVPKCLEEASEFPEYAMRAAGAVLPNEGRGYNYIPGVTE